MSTVTVFFSFFPFCMLSSRALRPSCGGGRSFIAADGGGGGGGGAAGAAVDAVVADVAFVAAVLAVEAADGATDPVVDAALLLLLPEVSSSCGVVAVGGPIFLVFDPPSLLFFSSLFCACGLIGVPLFTAARKSLVLSSNAGVLFILQPRSTITNKTNKKNSE